MMKKILPFLAVLLMIAMMITMVSCNKDKDKKSGVVDDESGTEESSETGVQSEESSEQSVESSEESEESSGQSEESGTPEPPVTFEETDETVYVLASSLNVRKEADFDSQSLGQLVLGQAVKRTGYNETYSRILFDDDNDEATDPIVAYVSSSYVTTENVSDADFTVLETPDTVYVAAESALNMRMLPNASGAWLATLKRGQELTRISYGESWTKVSYTFQNETTGQEETVTGYVYSKYLAAINPLVTEAKAKDFTAEGVRITLTEDFSLSEEEDEYTLTYTSTSLNVYMLKDSFSSLEDAGLVPAGMTLKQYADVMISTNGISATTVSENGLTYFVYEKTADTGNTKNFVSVYKSADAFWAVQFAVPGNAYDTWKDTITTFAKSVLFEAA